MRWMALATSLPTACTNLADAPVEEPDRNALVTCVESRLDLRNDGIIDVITRRQLNHLDEPVLFEENSDANGEFELRTTYRYEGEIQRASGTFNRDNDPEIEVVTSAELNLETGVVEASTEDRNNDGEDEVALETVERNDQGDPIRQRRFSPSESEAPAAITYMWDSLRRPVSYEEDLDEDGVVTSRITWEYYAQRLVTTRQDLDADGRWDSLREVETDPVGRLILDRTDSGANGSWDVSTRYFYDDTLDEVSRTETFFGDDEDVVTIVEFAYNPDGREVLARTIYPNDAGEDERWTDYEPCSAE